VRGGEKVDGGKKIRRFAGVSIGDAPRRKWSEALKSTRDERSLG